MPFFFLSSASKLTDNDFHHHVHFDACGYGYLIWQTYDNSWMFYGMGAGKLPTASAVVSDIIDIARGGSMTAHWTAAAEGSFTDGSDKPSDYCIRLPRKLAQDAVKEADGEYTYIVTATGEALVTEYPDAIAAYKII